MAYNTKPIVKDVDGNPISQYYNPDTDSYEPVEGSHGANKVLVENTDLSLIPILEKLSQLTGTVIDEETRKSNELQRIDNEDTRQSNENIRNTNEIERIENENIRIENENTRIENENIRKANEQNRVELYNDLINKVNSGYFDGKNLEFHWRGTELGVRVEGETEYIYVDLKGETGNIDNLTRQHIETALGYTPVKSVNNVLPDETGNVELDIDTSEIENRIGNVENDLVAHKADFANLKGFIGYMEDDIYGVEADFVNNRFTRLAGAVGKTPGADFDNIKAFGGRKRCNLADDGTVNAYYGDVGFIEDGSNGQVMVEQPKFYYKVVPLGLEKIQDGKGYHMRKARYYVSDTPKVGFKVHPAFVRNGVEVDNIYLSAYEGSIYDVSAAAYLLADEQVADFNADKLSSIAYAKPASGLTQILTRANTRKLAENRGAGWQQKDALCASASQMLMMIEYAAFNMQSAIGLGVVNKPSGEGNESELTGATSNLGNASGMAAGTNGLVSISYRGEENFWGNIWAWIDGLNVYIDPDTRKTDAYWAAEDFSDNTGSAPYKHVGFNLAPNTDGYVSAFGWSEECDFLFLPTETLGNSALPVGDRFYNTQTGWRVALLGGNWHNGLAAGAFSWYVITSAASRYRALGGGAVYVPQAS